MRTYALPHPITSQNDIIAELLPNGSMMLSRAGDYGEPDGDVILIHAQQVPKLAALCMASEQQRRHDAELADPAGAEYQEQPAY